MMASAAEPRAIVSNGTAAANGTANAFVPFMDQITMAKTIAMLVLGLGSFVLGVVPLQLTKCWRRDPPSPETGSSNRSPLRQPGHGHGGESAATGSPIVSLLLCFGGGVMLFTTLLHLQPEVRQGVLHLQTAGRLPNGTGTEHLGDLIFCAGFFMVFIVDEIVHTLLDRCAANSDGDGDSAEEVLQRSMSLRRRTMSIPRPSLVSSSSVAGVGVVGGGGSGGTSSTVSSFKELLRGGQQRRSVGGVTAAARGDIETRILPEPATDGTRVSSRGTAGGQQYHSFGGLFAVLALSFHEVFEGVAIGLEERTDDMWYLFVAVATHKLVIAFCIGLELAWSRTRAVVLVVYVATFAFVTPVGIAVGMLVRSDFAATGSSADDSHSAVAVVLQGLAAGTLLYVVFFEVLARHKQSGFAHLLSILIGFSFLLTVQLCCEYLSIRIYLYYCKILLYHILYLYCVSHLKMGILNMSGRIGRISFVFYFLKIFFRNLIKILRSSV